MINITVIQPDGTSISVEARPGESVMSAAIRANAKGIAADCGGNCACATCHVYLDDDGASLVPPSLPDENAMLEEVAAERRSTSRLSCQIHSTPALDGLVVHVAARQY